MIAKNGGSRPALTDRYSDLRLVRAAAAAAGRHRPRPWLVLLVSLAFEAVSFAMIGSVSQTKHILGIPGSLMALTAVVAGALGGPLVGLVVAISGGAMYFVLVADLGERGSWPATLVSGLIWIATALIASLLADALRRQSKRLEAVSLYSRSLIEASLDPLVTISPEGTITDVNEATEEVTGIDREHVIGTDFSDYFTEPEEARKGYRQVFREGLVRDYPLAIRHASGRVTDVLYNARVYRDQDGETVGVFAAARDVTERLRAERGLREAEAYLRAEKEELARSNADLEQFAYVASHDLQEPLRMVASYTQLLARRYRGRLDDDVDEFIGYAVDGANRMQELINDLLAFSRVGTRGETFAPTECETAFKEAVANLKTTIEESDAEVTSDPLPTIVADRAQIIQLFQNLIGNAIKFRGQEPPRVHVSAERADAEWVFSVRDNGIGIEPAYFERIFLIFQRLHTRDEFPGTGIGLALCKKIVTRHGGRIWIESAIGHGTTFHFTLPIQGDS